MAASFLWGGGIESRIVPGTIEWFCAWYNLAFLCLAPLILGVVPGWGAWLNSIVMSQARDRGFEPGSTSPLYLVQSGSRVPGTIRPKCTWYTPTSRTQLPFPEKTSASLNSPPTDINSTQCS